MKIYAVFDTNILVSAMISKRSDTAVVLALDTLLNDEVIPLYDDEIIKEYNDVLHREKFHLPEALVNSVIDHIQKAGIPSNRVHSDEVFPDDDDVVFYEVALSQEDSFLVTGNTKYFPKTPIVVTPLEFLKKIGKI